MNPFHFDDAHPIDKHLESLNQPQRDAVLSTDGPLLIIAGAGAGKTKTLTHRILHLIKNGAQPSSILAITFTNKAAKEMKERVSKLLREDEVLQSALTYKEQPYLSTFHSLGVHIIKENAQKIGLTRHFTIFDRSDSKSAVKQAIIASDLDPKQFEPNKVLGMISRLKGDMISLNQYEADAGSDYMPRMIAKVWAKYEAILFKEKAVDFDDLLLKAALLLKNHPDVREHYQNVWKYVHIDEYQDTNRVQYTIARILTEKHQNICVVGDADQTIYSWRGADIQNILNFEKDYPQAKIILLEQNYRSTQNILAAANCIIEKNTLRKKKRLFTKNEEGERVSFFMSNSESEEASYVADEARELIKKGVPASEIAVLYRANFQSRVLEEAFLRKSIPYQILGTRFFDRKEVKDVLSFIRASLNPDSATDLARIVNVPPRGIGKVTLLKMVGGEEHTLNAGAREKVHAFRMLLGRIRDCALKEKPSLLVKYIISETGVERTFLTGTEEDQERLENVRELVTLATKYDHLPPGEAVEALLSDAALATDQDELIENKNGVKLMTVHASKGLEFDYVFLPGLEEDLFPHQRMQEGPISASAAEEERRLFYVALTRARKRILLSFAHIRTIFGSQKVNVVSQFVNDLEEHIDRHEPEISSGAKAIFIDF